MSPRKPKPSSKPAPPVSYAPTTNFAWEVPWNQSPIVLTTVFGFLWLAGTLAFASRYAATAFVLWHLLIDGGIWRVCGWGRQPGMDCSCLAGKTIRAAHRPAAAAGDGRGAGAGGNGTDGFGIGAARNPRPLVGDGAGGGGVLILVLMLIAQVPTGTEAAARLTTPWAWASLLGRAGGDHRHDGGAHAARRDVDSGAQRL